MPSCREHVEYEDTVHSLEHDIAGLQGRVDQLEELNKQLTEERDQFLERSPRCFWTWTSLVIRKSGESHIDLDWLTGPGRNLPAGRGFLLVRGPHVHPPRFLDTTSFSQQEIFEYELIFASGKRSFARQALHFFKSSSLAQPRL
jgi:hypothetical protein